MYSIDQGAQAAAPDVTLKGSAVKIGMPSIGATYVGKAERARELDHRQLDRGRL
jgi:hypothetical protein